jgi:DNA end-binding protein Ku
MDVMNFANEVRDSSKNRRPKVKVPKREIDLAENLIDKMSAAEFEPEKYRDEYRQRFLTFIDQKVKGQEITVAPPTPERRGKVIDIFADLKQSLEQAAPQRPAAWQSTSRKTARKRRKA